jgi:anti-sigma B factor antagonist
MVELRVTTQTQAGVTTIALCGELDSYSAPRLTDLLALAMAGPEPSVLIDLTEVEYIDSTGLGVLVAALKQSTDKSGSLALVKPTEAVGRVLHITGLDKVFVIHEDNDAALSSIRAKA